MRIAECPAGAARARHARAPILPGPQRFAGFTLIEALVAIAILALVTLLAWRATAAMTDGESRLAAESAHWQQLDAVLTRIEADMRRAVPRDVRHGPQVEPAWLAAPDDAAGNTSLAFTRAGPDAIDEPGAGGQRVGYRWRDGRVEVVYWPRADNPATGDPVAYPLIGGIVRFRVLQLTADDRWSDHWPFLGTSAIPRAVRIELVLADGGVVERWLALQ